MLALAGCKDLVQSRTNLDEDELKNVPHKLLPSLSLYRVVFFTDS